MKKFKSAAFLCAIVLSLSPLAGCSSTDEQVSSAPSSSSSSAVREKTEREEINVSVAEEADKNDTGFILNSVIDSGAKAESGERYLYLDVTIKNTSDTKYELNVLNNFYLLTNDGKEIGFDVRSQIYAANNFKGYTSNPFEVPANGEFKGYIGGFCVPEEQNNFTVCFFPTGTDDTNKENVIKVPVTLANIIAAPADFKG